MSGERDWVYLRCEDHHIRWAQEFQKEREQIINNHYYDPMPDDNHWCGHLAERRIAMWMSQEHIPHTWITDGDGTGLPDFRVGRWEPGRGIAVDLKCRRLSRGAMQPRFEVGVGGWHVRSDKAIAFMFSCYEEESHNVVILGGMWQYDIFTRARHYVEGDEVHKNLVIRPGGDLYNLFVHQLMPPWDFLMSLLSGGELTA